MTGEQIYSTEGVTLPTGGWVDLPNSPFQICAWIWEPAGTFKVRIRPNASPPPGFCPSAIDWNPRDQNGRYVNEFAAPTACELLAGHAGRHRSGQTIWGRLEMYEPQAPFLVEQLSADVNDEIPTFEEHIHEWELISTHDSGDHFRCKLIWPSTAEHCDEMFFIVAGNTFGPPEGLLGRRIITRSNGKATAQTVPTCAHGNRRHPGPCIPTATTKPRQDSHLGRDTGSEDV